LTSLLPSGKSLFVLSPPLPLKTCTRIRSLLAYPSEKHFVRTTAAFPPLSKTSFEKQTLIPQPYRIEVGPAPCRNYTPSPLLCKGLPRFLSPCASGHDRKRLMILPHGTSRLHAPELRFQLCSDIRHDFSLRVLVLCSSPPRQHIHHHGVFLLRRFVDPFCPPRSATSSHVDLERNIAFAFLLSPSFSFPFSWSRLPLIPFFHRGYSMAEAGAIAPHSAAHFFRFSLGPSLRPMMRLDSWRPFLPPASVWPLWGFFFLCYA